MENVECFKENTIMEDTVGNKYLCIFKYTHDNETLVYAKSSFGYFHIPENFLSSRKVDAK